LAELAKVFAHSRKLYGAAPKKSHEINDV